MPVDWGVVREQFPALDNWTYLNTATFGQTSRRVTEAVMRHFDRRDRLACQDYMEWYDDADGVRRQVARFIGAAPSDIAFIVNAATALSLMLGGIDWKPGDRVVTLENEFPNQYYYPALLGDRGVEFVQTPWERFHESITPRTRLVALSSVSYVTGFRAPLEEIGRFLRERGVLLFVDGTQSVGALRFDVRAVQPDMLAVHAYKWLCAPNAAGFLYASAALRERLAPNVIGWRSDKGWRNPERLGLGEPRFSDDAEKYEGGMLNFAGVYALGEALAMQLEIGTGAIEARVMEMVEKTRTALRRAGARLLSDEHPHYDSQIISAAFERDTEELARRLMKERVLVASRHGRLRISPHFYNLESDVERLEQALRA